VATRGGPPAATLAQWAGLLPCLRTTDRRLLLSEESRLSRDELPVRWVSRGRRVSVRRALGTSACARRSRCPKRVASAVGEGAMAVQFVHEHLKEM
jgi:hypothetical protein